MPQTVITILLLLYIIGQYVKHVLYVQPQLSKNLKSRAHPDYSNIRIIIMEVNSLAKLFQNIYLVIYGEMQRTTHMHYPDPLELTAVAVSIVSLDVNIISC